MYTQNYRVGAPYPASKAVDACTAEPNNLSARDTFPLSNSGSPAESYIIDGDPQQESVGYGYAPKHGKKGAYYNTGDYYKDDE